MNVLFREGNNLENKKDIIVQNGQKFLELCLGGNGDLFLSVINKEDDNQTQIGFLILKNDEIYPYFDKLYEDVINCNVYTSQVSEFKLMTCRSQEEKNRLIFKNECQNAEMNELLKTGSEYQKLVQEGKIVWFSDDAPDERANKLIIKKDKEQIVFNFVKNEDEHSSAVRISNSGSKYRPFNSCFMKMFIGMQELQKPNKKPDKSFAK